METRGPDYATNSGPFCLALGSPEGLPRGALLDLYLAQSTLLARLVPFMSDLRRLAKVLHSMLGSSWLAACHHSQFLVPDLHISESLCLREEVAGLTWTWVYRLTISILPPLYVRPAPPSSLRPHSQSDILNLTSFLHSPLTQQAYQHSTRIPTTFLQQRFFFFPHRLTDTDPPTNLHLLIPSSLSWIPCLEDGT